MLVYDDSLQIKWKEEPYPKGNNTEYEIREPKQTQVNMFDVLAGQE